MSIDPPTLRDRAEHAAKYGANLVVPATTIVELLNERDHATTTTQAARAILDEDTRWTDGEHQLARIRRALDGAALAEGGGPR